jgi:lipopolysaccharide transport system ATP-binding protein
LLDEGGIKQIGEINQVISHYLTLNTMSMAEHFWSDPETAPGDQVARLKSVRVISQGEVTGTVDIRYPVIIEIEYWNLEPNANLMVGLHLFDSQGVNLFGTADLQQNQWYGPRPVGLYKSWCEIPGNLFAEGEVKVMAEVCTRKPFWKSHVREMNVVAFNVVDTSAPGSVRAEWEHPIAGVMRPMVPWKTVRIVDGTWN